MSARSWGSAAMAVHERAELRDRIRVFRDRGNADEVLAAMTDGPLRSEKTVLAVSAFELVVRAEERRATVGNALFIGMTPWIL